MLSGEVVARTWSGLGITHVVWLPDSVLGTWESAIESSPLELVRICREGEAWPLAAGLHLGGARPLVVIQCTGLFESGDALRNVLFDLRLPIFSIIGYRSYLVPNAADTARQFTEPILSTWGIDYRLIEMAEDWPRFAEHYRQCQQQRRPGAVLIAEGRM